MNRWESHCVKPLLKEQIYPRSGALVISRALLAATFVFAGVMHFVATKTYMSVVPPYLPHPRELVIISGVCEIAGGIGVLIPSLRRMAGWGLIALLIAVFPANVEMALHGHTLGHTYVSSLLGWLRLPLQAVLIAWVWRSAAAPGQVSPGRTRLRKVAE